MQAQALTTTVLLKKSKKKTDKDFFIGGREDSLLNVSLHVLFCLIVVIAVSSGMRLTETLFFSEHSPFKETLIIAPVMAAELENKAELYSRTAEHLSLGPTDTYRIEYKYKNTGTTTWNFNTTQLKTSTTGFKYSNTTWQSLYFPTQMKEANVAPGQIGTFSFMVKAPKYYGEYSGEFMLVQDNVMIPGGEVTLKMTVSGDAVAEAPITTPIGNPEPVQMCTLKLNIANAIDGTDNATCAIKFGFPENGPDIRVGILNSEEAISIKNNQAWQVYDQSETLLASIPAETEIKFFYSNTAAKYSFDFVDKTIRVDSYLKLNNFNNGIFTVTSLQDSPTWNRSINYNKFSGDLEIRHNDYKDRTWLIETLPLEDYVRGIKETSNYDPIEYLKTMTVAARTYALYHHNTGTKHAKEFYDVDSLYDQVYKGYVVRDVLPKLQQAVDETKGVVGTYNDQLIIAPYFARSDGRTRSYKEVWYRDVPYLVSVKTPYTEGRTMFGHGVGIDATDARERAEHDSWTYDQLLKYYYTGVKLEKIY